MKVDLLEKEIRALIAEIDSDPLRGSTQQTMRRHYAALENAHAKLTRALPKSKGFILATVSSCY